MEKQTRFDIGFAIFALIGVPRLREMRQTAPQPAHGVER
jgi:hypothetical protein